MRRGSIVALLGIGLIAGGIATAAAVVPTWLPEDASREAGRIDFVFWFVIAICIAIFALVAAVMIYAVLRFRVRPDDNEDGPPIHGHTGLEITWTAIPFVLVTAIAVVSAIVLSRNDAEAQNTLHINVTSNFVLACWADWTRKVTSASSCDFEIVCPNVWGITPFG